MSTVHLKVNLDITKIYEIIVSTVYWESYYISLSLIRLNHAIGIYI